MTDRKQNGRPTTMGSIQYALLLLFPLVGLLRKVMIEPGLVRGFTACSNNDRTLYGSPSLFRQPRLDAWSKAVEMDVQDIVEDPTHANDDDPTVKEDVVDECVSNAMSPREWLEFCEQQSGYPGAYTVLRCDFLLNENNTWTVWGIDFHMHRLQESFRSLLQTLPVIDDAKGRSRWEPSATDEDVKIAIAHTQTAIQWLLDEASGVMGTLGMDTGGVVTTMVTLLWEPHFSSDNGNCNIRVKAHAFSTLTISQSKPVNNPNMPVTAVVGYLPTSGDLDDDMVLPNRYDAIPNAKLSSWCRRRRPLEDMFQRPNIGDVILTKCYDDDDDDNDSDGGGESPNHGKGSPSRTIELLEGLTSNLFVVGPGRTLRTPPSSSVLGGYARHLVMDVANRCGYRIDVGPIFLNESSLWEEMFLTSSVRLIVPVRTLLQPSRPSLTNASAMQYDTIWEIPNHGNDDLLACHVLYREICQQQDG